MDDGAVAGDVIVSNLRNLSNDGRQRRAAKTAYVEARRLRAADVWGGGAHYFFQQQWLRESTRAESYLMDHDIAPAGSSASKTLSGCSSPGPSFR